MNILVAYPVFPEYDTNAGGLRLAEILRILVSAGHQVYFVARRANHVRYREALEKSGIECMVDSEVGSAGSVARLRAFCEKGHFDLAILVHHETYREYAPALRAFLPRCHCVLDTVDLHCVRCQREAELGLSAEAFERARRVYAEEAEAIQQADTVWVVTPAEADYLESRSLVDSRRVRVIPLVHRVLASFPPFANRDGIVFLGGYRHAPNVDAIDSFMAHGYEILRGVLPGVRFTIAGSHPPPHFQRYAEKYPEVRVTGFLEDHRSVLLSHRVGIAPLRYGAGMKGKICEYFCCGLPCVTTAIGAEGMDVVHEREILIADDPEAFAHEVARLYGDRSRWMDLSKRGAAYICGHLSPQAVSPAILSAIRAAQPHIAKVDINSQWATLRAIVNPSRWAHLYRASADAFQTGGFREFRAQLERWKRR